MPFKTDIKKVVKIEPIKSFFQSFFGVPHLATSTFYFFLYVMNQNHSRHGFDTTSSIGRGSNPRLSDRELSALPLDHSFRLNR